MKRTKTTLKSYFQTGDKPTQTEYENLIDSLRHLDDKIPLTDLEEEVAKKDEDNQFSATQTFNQPITINGNGDSVFNTSLVLNDALTANTGIDINSGDLRIFGNSSLILEGNASFEDEVSIKTKLTIGEANTATLIIQDDYQGGDSGIFREDNDGVIAATFDDGRFGYGGFAYNTILNIKNDKVGIGIDNTTPVYSLDVAGNGRFSELLIANAGITVNQIINTPTNTDLHIRPNGTGNIHFGNSGDGNKLFHYSQLNDGKYTTFFHNATQSVFDTTSTDGFLFEKKVTVNGDIQASGNYISSDGTPGYNGNFTVGIYDITVKDGLITDVVNIS